MKIPDFHREIYALGANKDLRRVAIVAPTGFGKSSVVSYTLPIWATCYGHYEEILIVSSSAEFAESRLLKIKAEFEANENIQNDFRIRKSDIWRNNEARLSNGVAIFARGKYSQITGMRPGLIILDDIETEDEARSELERTRLYQWFYLTLTNRPKAELGRIFIIGSISNRLSFLNNFITPEAEKIGWVSRVYATNDGKTVWKEMWDDETLAQKRKELSPLPGAYEALYEADVTQFQRNAFKREWLRFYPKAPDGLRIFTAVDPGAGEKEADSYTAIVTCGYDLNSGIVYVLDVIKRRYNVETLEMFGAMFLVYDVFRPLKFGIESVVFQKYIKAFFERECRERGKTPNIIELKRDNKVSKDARIRSLAHWFESGKIFIRPDQYSLIAEYEAYPEVVTNDVLDALSMCINDMIMPGKISANKGQVRKPAMRKQYGI